MAAEAEGARRTQRSRRSGMRHERRSSSLCTTAYRYASEHRHPLRAVQSVLKPPLAAVAITIRTRCSLRSRRRRKSTACTTVRTSPPSLILMVAVAVARSCTPSSRRNERDQPPHSSTACTNCRRPFFSPAVGFYGAVRLPPSMFEEFRMCGILTLVILAKPPRRALPHRGAHMPRSTEIAQHLR